MEKRETAGGTKSVRIEIVETDKLYCVNKYLRWIYFHEILLMALLRIKHSRYSPEVCLSFSLNDF